MAQQGLCLSIYIYFFLCAYINCAKQLVPIQKDLNTECFNLIWTVPEGGRASFEIGSSLFSTKISFSFIYIRICIYLLLKLSVLLQFSTFHQKCQIRKHFETYHNLQINYGGVSFMAIRVIGGTVHWCRRTEFCMLSLISEKGKYIKSIAFLDELLTVLNPPKQEAWFSKI